MYSANLRIAMLATKTSTLLLMTITLSGKPASAYDPTENERSNASDCSRFFTNKTLSGINSGFPQEQCILMFIIFGVFAAIIAKVFNFIRAKIYLDDDSLDTAFDAGGRVSAGLTSTTLVSQWTWAATLLQSSGVTSKYGISGAFWYAAGATVQMLLFAVISVQLKIRAPGAKTFLQVIRVRFGRTAHIVFCVFALLTNIIVTSMLMLGGAAVLTRLVDGLSVELATFLITIVIGSYTFIGGLGATFYVSYFNTAIIFIIIITFALKVFHDPQNDSNYLGSPAKVYELLVCREGPPGNKDRSLLTILSKDGLMFGIINLVGNFGTVFVDQSYWQSTVAAKPQQGVWGFISGGLVWFAVPFAFATTMGLSYNALSTINNGEPLLNIEDVNAGLVPPVVAQIIMGRVGETLILLMLMMAVVSTGSAEVMAVTSILIFDVIQVYVRPFRVLDDKGDFNKCVLCGRHRGRLATPLDKCICQSMTICTTCHMDNGNLKENRTIRHVLRNDYQCRTHGAFRKYQKMMGGMRSWCMLWTTFSIVPLTLILEALKVSLGWVYLFMGVVIGSSVVPIVLCMMWAPLTAPAMVVGTVGGCVAGLAVWLGVASTYPGGIALKYFMDNTGQELSMLCGNLASIIIGGLLTTIITVCTPRSGDAISANEVWEGTRDIDNPLAPWTEMYARELHMKAANELNNRPSIVRVSNAFRSAKLISYVGSISLTVVMLIVWPALMVFTGVMELRQFINWINVAEAWMFLAAAFIIVVPIYHEYAAIRSAKRTTAKVTMKRDLGLALSQGASGNTNRLNPNSRGFRPRQKVRPDRDYASGSVHLNSDTAATPTPTRISPDVVENEVISIIHTESMVIEPSVMAATKP